MPLEKKVSKNQSEDKTADLMDGFLTDKNRTKSNKRRMTLKKQNEPRMRFIHDIEEEVQKTFSMKRETEEKSHRH